MFKKTRNKLTLIFAILIFLFLILSNIATYMIFSNQLYEQRKTDIRKLAEENANLYQYELLDHSKDSVEEKHFARKDKDEDEDEMTIGSEPLSLGLILHNRLISCRS
ncbi:MAG: hypothetical protein WDZ91_09805 [Paenibacillaceae bacterium]